VVDVGGEACIARADADNRLVKEAVLGIAAKTELGEFAVVGGRCLVQHQHVRGLLELREAVGVFWR